MVAKCEGEDEGFEVSSYRLAGEGFANLFDGWIFRIDGGAAELVEGDAQADGRASLRLRSTIWRCCLRARGRFWVMRWRKSSSSRRRMAET